MAIGFIPNRKASSKVVWTMLLIIKRPISWSVLVLSTAVSGLVMGLGV